MSASHGLYHAHYIYHAFDVKSIGMHYLLVHEDVYA